MNLSPEDHARVTAAVTAAERTTDGEILAVAAEKSDSYHDVALHYAVLAMLLVPALLATLPQAAADRVLAWLGSWNAEPSRATLMAALFVLLALAFLLVRLMLASMPLRIALTPGRTRSRRVHRRAVMLFRAACEARTRRRTGILIYLSLRERRAEIVADEAIACQIPPERWGEAMAMMLDEVKAGRPGEGLAKAICAVGAVLSEILPPGPENPDELPDRLIEL